jgi:hypothetical protein
VSPQIGDVVVSKRSAEIEHAIGIVPQPPDVVCPTHDRAVARAQSLAESLCVDAWLTIDHIHFLRLASHRTASH